MATIQGLKRAHSHECCVHTDSKYVHDGITCWINGWKSRGWRKSDGKPILNQDLWVELDSLNSENVTWEWVRGHSGNPYNERCDLIATSFSKGATVCLNGVQSKAVNTQPIPQTTIQQTQSTTSENTTTTYPCYISLVNGVIERHSDWAHCRAATNGRSSLLKKVKSLQEEETLLASWKTMGKL